MIKLSPLERIIAKMLVDSAINKAGNFTYSEITEILMNEHDLDVNPHYGLSKPLGNISILCHEMGLPLLSVRVQYKNDTSGKTAEGFYSIARDLIPEYKSMQPNEVRSRELTRTRNCKSWQPLLDYLGAKTTASLSVPEQMRLYVEDVIVLYGIGHTLSTQEIENELVKRHRTNRNSIMPNDYSYNWYSKNLALNRPLYFEYMSRTQYRVLGNDAQYNGYVYAHPKGESEQIVGYCLNGKQHLGKMPVYPDDIPDDSVDYKEGKKKSVIINTYERNPAARQACIEHYGAVCFICNFDAGLKYGVECEGLIVVHHLKMISEICNEYVIDPINDLRPVCPNCHMIIHSNKDGLYSIKKVKEMLTSNSTKGF